jgi:murein L,D-transpeptidase YafK/ketosteroid isomerase-like protein
MKYSKYAAFIFLYILCICINTHAEEKDTPEAVPELLPDVFLPFAAPKQPLHVILVEKDSQQFFVYEYKDKPREILRFDCSTGKNTGPKMREGDSRTPEGIYFFIDEHQDSELAPIYGKGAFPTDYPNPTDRMAGKTGSEIWLHGTNRELKDRDSNGCIVLKNEDFETVKSYIRLRRTPIIITDILKKEPFEPDGEDRDILERFLSGWAGSLENGTYHAYLVHYDPDFLPDIRWWPGWNQNRKDARSKGESYEVSYQNMAVFRHRDLFVGIFDLYLGLGDRKIYTARKILYFKRRSRDFAIIAEKYLNPEDISENKREKFTEPVLLASRKLLLPEKTVPSASPPVIADTGKTVAPSEPLLTEKEITAIEKTVSDWLAAWSSMNIRDYGAYYADDFFSQGMNREKWLAYKERLNQKYRYIRVSGKKIKTKADRDGVLVSFEQRYESDRFQSRAMKLLRMKQVKGQWKIYRESSGRL